MLERVRIVNFQSLKDVSLELGQFTVIVGASSSGKSAFLRAVKAVATNPRGTSFVTHGEKIASVSLEGSEWTVGLSRGEGHGEYRTLRGTEEKVYTKLAGAVPEGVSELLKFGTSEEGTSLAFAGQFDSPYLLSASGTSVAASLGSLTRVSELLEASREANRRRLSCTAALKVREEDLSSLKTELEAFPDLQLLEDRTAAAEGFYLQLEAKLSQYAALKELTEKIALLDGKLVELPPILDASELTLTLSRYESLDSLVRTAEGELARVGYADVNLKVIQDTHAALETKLKNLGTCPLCERTF